MTSDPALGRDLTPYAALARFPDRTRPLVTHYSGAEQRIELSVASVANAVAKAAGLLRDELGLAPGEAIVSIDLPRHWQLPVWTMAALSVGARVGRDLPGHVHARVVGPDVVATQQQDRRGEGDVEAGSMRTADDVLLSACDPFGLPVPGPVLAEVEAVLGASGLGGSGLGGSGLGGSVLDVGIAARTQPDHFTPDPGAGDAGALVEADGTSVPWSVSAHRSAAGRAGGDRLWIDERTADSELLVLTALVPLVLTGSVVIATRLTRAQADHVRAVERVSLSG